MSATALYADIATNKLQNATDAILGREQVKSIRLRVELNSKGQVIAATVDSGSGSATLDSVAKRIAATAAPFDPFPQEMSQQMDVLVIERTFVAK